MTDPLENPLLTSISAGETQDPPGKEIETEKRDKRDTEKEAVNKVWRITLISCAYTPS